MKSRIIILGFILLIFAPTLDNIFNFSSEFKNSENRALSTFPVLRLSTVRSFASQFRQYYKENFGFRNPLFYAYSRWKYYVLHESPLPERVVLGKDGWLYLGNSSNQVIDQHRGLISMPLDTLHTIATRLEQRQQELAQRGIKLVIFIAPDTQTIYPENLPDWAFPSFRPSRLDKFIAYMKQTTTIPIVDVRDTLTAVKPIRSVYFQTNTHWNSFGAIVSCAALLNQLQTDFPTLSNLREKDYTITQMPGYTGDLAELCMLQSSLIENNYCQVSVNKRLSLSHIDTLTVVASNYKALRITGPDLAKPRLFFIGDSFVNEGLVQYLPAYFSQSYFIRSRYLDLPLVMSERPNVVVVEIVERNLNWLRDL